jgi:hypothetical protein
MPSKNINHAAAWVGAIAFFVWGYLWHAVLFKNQYMTFMSQNMTPTSPMPYIVAFIVAVVIGYGSAIALADSEHPTASHGISFGLFMGVVFYAGITLTQSLFRGEPLGLWLLDAGFALIGFALVGAIVGGWKRRAAAA